MSNERCVICFKSFKEEFDFSRRDKESLILFKRNIYQNIFEYNILFGKYSIECYRGVNCQTFSNLFINLCKGNPSHFKDGFKNKSIKGVIKRIQMIIYLYEMNINFISKKI